MGQGCHTVVGLTATYNISFLSRKICIAYEKTDLSYNAPCTPDVGTALIRPYSFSLQGSQENQQETCFKVKRGLYNLRTDFDSMSVCVKKESEALAPLRRLRCAADLRKSLIAHWKMDDELRYGVVDDSGNEQHGRATADVLSKWGKFSRGRLFNANMGNIVIPNSPIINVGKSSFSFAGWVKTTDVTYPMTNFAVLKGYGCYQEAGNSKWVPGWDIGHMYRSTSTNVCIRDHLNNKVFDNFLHAMKLSYLG